MLGAVEQVRAHVAGLAEFGGDPAFLQQMVQGLGEGSGAGRVGQIDLVSPARASARRVAALLQHVGRRLVERGAIRVDEGVGRERIVVILAVRLLDLVLVPFLDLERVRRRWRGLGRRRLKDVQGRGLGLGLAHGRGGRLRRGELKRGRGRRDRAAATPGPKPSERTGWTPSKNPSVLVRSTDAPTGHGATEARSARTGVQSGPSGGLV